MLAFNDSDLVRAAALAGQGVGCIFQDRAAPFVEQGQLVTLLEAFCAPLAGFALYHAGRRQMPAVLVCFIEALRAPALHQPDPADVPLPGKLVK